MVKQERTRAGETPVHPVRLLGHVADFGCQTRPTATYGPCRHHHQQAEEERDRQECLRYLPLQQCFHRLRINDISLHTDTNVQQGEPRRRMPHPAHLNRQPHVKTTNTTFKLDGTFNTRVRNYRDQVNIVRPPGMQGKKDATPRPVPFPSSEPLFKHKKESNMPQQKGRSKIDKKTPPTKGGYIQHVHNNTTSTIYPPYLFHAKLLVALPPLSRKRGVAALSLQHLGLLDLLMVRMSPGLLSAASGRRTERETNAMGEPTVYSTRRVE